MAKKGLPNYSIGLALTRREIEVIIVAVHYITAEFDYREDAATEERERLLKKLNKLLN